MQVLCCMVVAAGDLQIKTNWNRWLMPLVHQICNHVFERRTLAFKHVLPNRCECVLYVCRYYTVTGQQADDETIESIIETGQSETFLQKAIQEQGRGHVIETIREIQERHDSVKQIEKNLLELHQIFMDMAVLVEAQGEQLNNIEAQVNRSASYVERGTTQLRIAKSHQRSARKWTCIGIILLLILAIIIVFPVLKTTGVLK